ncbi:MAG: hypothetical protein ACLVE2_19570 [Bacteroides caccae]|mgnify:FL=1
MAKLEGIIYTAFRSYIVLRGFAPIGGLAKISKKPASYQRDANEQHKVEIVHYLNDLKSYFPEITLACRVSDYEGLMRSIGDDKDVSKEDSIYVKGLRILSERLPIGRDRARHAYLEIDNPNEEEKLLRVDGNHRLEPFSTDIEWWHQFISDRSPIKDETDPEKIQGWLNHRAKTYKKEIAEKIVPFTIIMSEAKDADNFEAKIFHDINFKALPLREEASLRIISELQAFDDKEKLGHEYPMALQLIDKIQSGRYDKIPWLKVTMNVENEYYRTACLRIVQLLNKRASVINDSLDKEFEELEKTKNSKIEAQKTFEEQELIYQRAKETLDGFKFDGNTENRKIAEKEYSKEKSILQIKRNELFEAEHTEKQSLYKTKIYKSFLHNVSSIESIINAIDVVRGEYDLFKENEYGNIAFLCAMVYYALLDKNKLKSFVNWATQNGITRIVEPDDLSKDASNNLVDMFEQIHRAKANEIFISMQFGDSQSELIYEKIVRAIEKFNAKHKTITLNARPIRVDRTIESSTFSIQDKILDAIQSCSLIIADLSSANINVYHEIGYAMGVAQSHNMIPNMILLYKEDTDHNKEKKDVDKFIGFNLRNLSQLRFKDYFQLIDGLVERLEKHYGV